MEIDPGVREFLSAIGSKKTEKKSAASRENAARALAAKMKKHGPAVCTCGSVDGKHTSQCKLRRAEYARAARARKKV